MCGIFGLVRPTGPGGEIPSRILLTLGTLAEACGIDAAGLACWTGAAGRTEGWLPTLAGQPVASLDGWRIHKRLGRFRDLPWREVAADLRAARVVLGHTRYAVQGDPYRLDHGEPLPAGSVLGTYSGNVNTAALRWRYRRPLPGVTDGQVVLGAVAGQDVPGILELLATLPGPAALAWADRGRPERVWLARAAGSPLAVAFTAGGAALWASDEEWLRDAAFSWNLPLAGDGPQQLPEGTLLALDLGTTVRTAGRWSFRPGGAPGSSPAASRAASPALSGMAAGTEPLAA